LAEPTGRGVLADRVGRQAAVGGMRPDKITTSFVAVVIDVVRDGRRVVGYGFNSNGRYGQGGPIREGFRERILEAGPAGLMKDAGTNLDPHRIWAAAIANEKPGGHGERSVTVANQ
jgi:hypothetical protein